LDDFALQLAQIESRSLPRHIPKHRSHNFPQATQARRREGVYAVRSAPLELVRLEHQVLDRYSLRPILRLPNRRLLDLEDVLPLGQNISCLISRLPRNENLLTHRRCWHLRLPPPSSCHSSSTAFQTSGR